MNPLSSSSFTMLLSISCSGFSSFAFRVARADPGEGAAVLAADAVCAAGHDHAGHDHDGASRWHGRRNVIHQPAT